MPSPFVRKLRHGADLDDDDARVLESLCSPAIEVGGRREVIIEGDTPRALTLIESGWACFYRQLEDGRRQILELLLPGDLSGPFGVLPRLANHTLATLTPVTLRRILPQDAQAAAQSRPAIAKALWWDSLVHTAMLHERVVSLGQRSSVERLAHLLCELYARLGVVALADPDGFSCPLTQLNIGELLGLSTVHINRSLQELRASGTVTLRDKRVTILNLRALRQLAQFDERFLHLTRRPETRPEPSLSRSAPAWR